MNWSQVSLEAQPPQSWRNGGGLTRELLAWPDAQDWSLRLSVADVRMSGPFSRFDGIERWFAVLEGDGVLLEGPDGVRHLTQDSEPWRFDGAAPLHCTLVGGATRDFNLMALPGRSRMQRVRGAEAVRGGAGTLLALYTHANGARLQSAAGTLILAPYHLAWTRAFAAVEATLHAQDALWMEAST